MFSREQFPDFLGGENDTFSLAQAAKDTIFLDPNE